MQLRLVVCTSLPEFSTFVLWCIDRNPRSIFKTIVKITPARVNVFNFNPNRNLGLVNASDRLFRKEVEPIKTSFDCFCFRSYRDSLGKINRIRLLS